MKGYSFDELVKLAMAAVKRDGDTMTGNLTAPTFTGDLVGNAATATKLATARQINGTNFDGSGNITTANWGTARTLTIGNAAKSVNGAGNVSWSLSEIGAYHPGNKPSLGSDLGLQWQLPWAGGESLYIKLVTLGLTDNDITFVLAGFGDYGSTKRATYNVAVATRAAGISVAVNALDVDWFYGAKPIIYHRRVGESFEVWLRTPSYHMNSTFTRMSGNGDVVNIDSSTTTEPTGLTEVTINQIYTTRFKPTATDVGAVNKTGDTMTGELQSSAKITGTGNATTNYHGAGLMANGSAAGYPSIAFHQPGLFGGDIVYDGTVYTFHANNHENVASVNTWETFAQSQPTGPSSLTRKDYVDGQVATRAPTAHTHTVANITDLKPQDANATANTLALRDSEADVHARLLRATYQDQSDMSGALAFRTNNSTDNYTRYCSNPAAVREWMNYAKTSWHMSRRAYVEDPATPMTEYHIPGIAAVITYLTTDGNYRIASSNGSGIAAGERLRVDSSGNLFATAAIHEAGQRVYSPNNQPHYSHNHTAAQGNADIVAGSHSQIGTYMLAQSRANTVQTPGYTVAGSSLRPASAGDRYVDWQSLPGTWKLLGAIWDESNQVANRTSLWIRIS